MTTIPALVLAVIAIVRIPIPWWAPRFLVRRRFAQAVPEYARAPGLLRKAFTISDDGRFGGVYTWRSRRHAEAWFDAAWHARVRSRYGVDADLLLLEVTSDLAGPAHPVGAAVGEGVLRTDAVAMLLAGTSTGAPDPAGLARALGDRLFRLTSVKLADGSPGAVALFASRHAAETALSAARAGAVSAALGGTFSATGFEAPVLLENAR
jgi:heme-degrading monooxygenase HmoA